MIEPMSSTLNPSTTNWSSTIELRPPLRAETDESKTECHIGGVTEAVFERKVLHKGESYTVILCAASVQLFDAHHWGRTSRYGGYVRRWTRVPERRCLYFHRELLQPPAGMVVDHINGNGLDNRLSNLRVCTTHQNSFNQATRRSFGYHGVFPWRRKFKAQIAHLGVAHYLGLFETREEAARAWDVKAIELRGEFAQLNFPPVGKPTYFSLGLGGGL